MRKEGNAKAVKRAAEIVEREAILKAPRAAEHGKRSPANLYGQLYKNISKLKVRKVRGHNDRFTATVGTGDAWSGYLVEKGFRAKGRTKGAVLRVAPNPFMEPAMAETADEQIRAMQKSLWDTIKKATR